MWSRFVKIFKNKSGWNVSIRSSDRLIDWLHDCLIDWLIDWLHEWLLEWLLDWLIDWLIEWVLDWLIDWLHVWVLDWLIVSVGDRLIDWLIDCGNDGSFWLFFYQPLVGGGSGIFKEYKNSTFSNLVKKTKTLFPFVWPKGDLRLKIYVMLSFLLLIAGRGVNLLTPIYYKYIG